MKKKIMLAVILIAIIAIGAAVYLVKDQQSVFNGDRVKNPDCYTLDFTEMNQKDAHTLVLHRGDKVSVDFAIERGTVDLIIGISSEKEIYRGNKINSGVFELTIPEDGEYRIDISARHASGFIRIYAHTQGTT